MIEGKARGFGQNDPIGEGSHTANGNTDGVGPPETGEHA